ncbi:FAD dependent oxidoreductase [Podospora australis]|uniref:FAD dependent oxidoreductase n=1 Tax=Podospora australis TaxID=1536484 RepID=A0AAN7ALK4_9PEZI|nr:FAD dependent oxidoreductase [Podospora australis]
MHEPATLPSVNPSQSYWLQSLSPVLKGHRTTEDLPEEADVVIVGSGITGAFAADFLLRHEHDGAEGSKEKKSVVMLEAREVCGGATGRNGGHCQPQVYLAVPEVAAFELETYEFLKTLAKEQNIDCDWVSFTGVHAFYSAPMFETAAASVHDLQQTRPSLGSQLEAIRGTDKARLADLKVPTAHGVIIQKKAASLWPYKLVAHVIEQLLPFENFNLQTNTPVTSLSPLSSGGWALETPRGMIKAKQVLLATNGYTSHLLPKFADLIVPTRSQISAVLPPNSGSQPAELKHSYLFAADPDVNDGTNAPRDDYLVQRPLPGGEIIYGGGRRFAKNLGVGVSSDEEVESQIAKYLRSNLSPPLDLTPPGKVIEGEGELKASYEWTGIMGYSRDQHAWVGQVPESLGGGKEGGLYICAGYSGHGMPSAALSGRAVVRLMLGLDEPQTVIQGGKIEKREVLPERFRVSEERLRRAREECAQVNGGWEVNSFATLI